MINQKNSNRIGRWLYYFWLFGFSFSTLPKVDSEFRKAKVNEVSSDFLHWNLQLISEDIRLFSFFCPKNWSGEENNKTSGKKGSTRIFIVKTVAQFRKWCKAHFSVRICNLMEKIQRTEKLSMRCKSPLFISESTKQVISFQEKITFDRNTCQINKKKINTKLKTF